MSSLVVQTPHNPTTARFMRGVSGLRFGGWDRHRWRDETGSQWEVQLLSEQKHSYLRTGASRIGSRSTEGDEDPANDPKILRTSAPQNLERQRQRRPQSQPQPQPQHNSDPDSSPTHNPNHNHNYNCPVQTCHPVATQVVARRLLVAFVALSWSLKWIKGVV